MTPALAGQRVVITRPRSRARDWIEAFEAAGAKVIPLPVFELVPVDGADKVQALEVLSRYAGASGSWLAFTSVPAVEHLSALIQETGARTLQERFRIACIGDATRRALDRAGFDVHLQPARASGVALAEELIATSGPRPQVLHPTSDHGLTTLTDAVNAAGGVGERLVVYRLERDAHLDPGALVGADPDLLTFASPSAAIALLERTAGDTLRGLLELPALAVGDTTARTLEDLGFRHRASAASPRIEDVVAAAVRLVDGTPSS